MSRAAFNLVELLIGMAVLALIVAVSAGLFRSADRAWNESMAQTAQDAAAQAVLSAITTDIESAMADHSLSFYVGIDTIDSYELFNSETAMLTLKTPDTTHARAVRAVMYWVREITNSAGGMGRYELVRGIHPPAAEASLYTNQNWYTDAPAGLGRPTADADLSVLAQNVACFGLILPPEYGTNSYHSVAHGDQLPRYVDIYLELLGEPDAIRAAALAGNTNLLPFVEQAARRYTATAIPRQRGAFPPP